MMKTRTMFHIVVSLTSIAALLACHAAMPAEFRKEIIAVLKEAELPRGMSRGEAEKILGNEDAGNLESTRNTEKEQFAVYSLTCVGSSDAESREDYLFRFDARIAVRYVDGCLDEMRITLPDIRSAYWTFDGKQLSEQGISEERRMENLRTQARILRREILKRRGSN